MNQTEPTEKDDKTSKVGVSLPDSIRSAAQREADRNHNGNFSAVIQAALRKYLAETGALTPSAEDRAQDALAKLIESEGPERATAIIEGALAASLAA